MTPLDWTVIGAGVAAVVWVNWYFFLAQRSGAAATLAAGSSLQQATITVQGGYSPAVIRVKAGGPVRLLFDRKENSSCSEEVVFGDFAIRQYLPANERTAVDIMPPKPGTYEFTCGMGMLRGRLIAE